MSGNVSGTLDCPLELFGSFVSDMAPADLPPGVSPDCADVAFIPGAVKTRPGLVSLFAPLGVPNPTVNYLKTFVMLDSTLRMLALQGGSGTLFKENPQGTLVQVATGFAINAYAQSNTQFGREYMAFSDGKAGVDIPRQFDDVNFDRVSQIGPGAGPTAVDTVEGAFTIIAAPNGAIRASNVVTIVVSVVHDFVAGQKVVIAGVTDASFNGTFTITSVPGATTFLYAQVAANASSGAGTATHQGNITVGVHQVAVAFKTRQGYITQPSPITKWTAAGVMRVSLTGIPVGPSNVIARIIMFTGAGGASFFYLGAGAVQPSTSMIINDNTTTTATFDFLDSDLLAGTLADPLFRQVELGECAGVIPYANRLFWWGERNRQNNWLNLTFDGGFSGNVPLGWTVDPGAPGPGGSKESATVVWGNAYRITGDGATATRGLITESAVQDANGVTRIAANTAYSVRARVSGTGITQGTLHVNLFSVSAGINTTGLQVTPPIGVNFLEYTAQLTASLAAIPSDLVLRVFVDGTPTNGGFFVIDNIEIFPTLQATNITQVRASFPNNPESYDGISGLLSVAVNNGQAIRAAFKLRERLYFVKEHSMYVTQDDGVNEPALWSVNEVSRVVGTPSVQGVDVGEDWAVIADRAGLYIFDGGEPTKVSQEIQPTWDSINWQFGHTIWVKVDKKNKRILCGVPIGTATSPNRILVLDYRSLHGGGAEIAGSPPIHRTYTGKIISSEITRKWAPWFITANSADFIERADGTADLFLGNGLGNGKIYRLSDTQFQDDGVAINSYYVPYMFIQTDLEQALQIGSHRKLFHFLTMFVEGSGSLNLSALPESIFRVVPLPSLTLYSPGTKDFELVLNLLAERATFKFGTNAVGAWFKMQRFIPSLKPDPNAPVRGSN